ncbi:hypothetical protein JCM33374_g1381 [Metschnikowia sp. JCM 33374]|nr:hypothetical protein JCM33374_g1381 [Metschnikowia sp. JCM 33374]
MHTSSYFGVVVPVLGTVYILCCSSVSLLVWRYDYIGRYFLAAMASQSAMMTFRMAWAARKSVLRYKQKLRKLPENPSSVFGDKFGVHVAEEVVKLGVLVFCSVLLVESSSSMMSYIIVVSGVFALNRLVLTLVTFSPANYSQYYGKFTRSLAKFESRSYFDKEAASVKPAASRRASEGSTLVSFFNDEPTKSEPTKSEPTKVEPPKTGATRMEPAKPLFKLDLFDRPSETPAAIPVRRFTDTSSAHSNMIDRLYSVSPRDTMYFSYEHFSESSDPRDVAHPAEDFASIVNNLGNPEEKVCEYPNMVFGGYLHDKLHQADDSAKLDSSAFDSAQSPNLVAASCISFDSSNPTSASITSVESAPPVSWWAWLLPHCNKEEPRVSFSRNKERALLKKKLSTFTLNSDSGSVHEKKAGFFDGETVSLKSAGSRNSYGTLDLEIQAPCMQKSIANSRRFYEFAVFSNKFLDFWSRSVHEILRTIDPAFFKFGTPIPRLSTFYFILYGASVCMWQFSSTLIVALPLIATNRISAIVAIILYPGVVIAKLFCTNYLHGQCTLSHQFSIGTEFGLNIILFVVACILLYLLASPN